MRWTAFFIFLLFATAALGQSAAATGTIAGIVTDAAGAAIPGAAITIKNTDFTSSRTVSTDDSGAFSATFLPAGNYTVEVKAPGFLMKRPARVTLGVGSSVRVNVRMELPQVKQEVTVTGTAPTVEGQTTAPTVNKQEPVAANTIAGLTVTYLPNRNRDFSQFAQLGAGVEPDADENGLVVAGQRPEDSKMAIDGADFNDPLNGGQRGARDGALFFPQTVVREFQIVHAGATAEVGGTNAGFVNVATKSGANKRRAEAFFIGRPATLTSRDAFGHPLDNQQYEFGGSVGGPIKKDRAFFYFGAEQDILRVPYWFQPAGSLASPLIAASIPAGFPSAAQIVSHTDPTAIFLRTDYILGPSNTLAVQFNVNRVDATNLNTGSTRTLAEPAHQDSLTGNSEWLRGSLTTIVSATTVNQVMAQWSRDQRSLLPNSTAPEQAVIGFAVLGGDSRGPDMSTTQRVQFSDDLSVSRGGKQFRVGGLYATEPTTASARSFYTPRLDYESLAFLGVGQPFRIRGHMPGGFENPKYDAAVQHAAVYADAKLPLGSTFTATMGLRWEGQWNPQPPRPNPLLPLTARVRDDAGMIQPRLGLAWNPSNSTVVRASAGLYDAATPANLFRQVFVDNGVNTVVIDSYFPFATLLGPPKSGEAFGMARNFRNPRSFQVSGTVEQQLSKSINASVAYLRNSTWALPRLIDDNLLPPTYSATGTPIFPVARPSTNVGRMLVYEANAHSSYDGLLVTTTFQLPRRSTITANYTLSHTHDDDSGSATLGEPTALDPFNPRAERADSNLDVRHNFNVSAVMNLPVGFKFNPIVIARSGAPYTPIIGIDTQRDANDFNDRAVINGRVAARNSFRQPSFFNLDFRFVKDITLRGEGHHLDLFLDVFNVTGASNRNFGPDGVSIVGPAATPVFSGFQPLFAPATTRYGSARQVQFTARIVAF